MRTFRWILIVPAAWMIMLACNFSSQVTPPGTLDQGLLYTAAASTLSVQLTEGALAATVTALSQPPATTQPTVPPTPAVSNTPVPTATPPPTATPWPPTATPVPPTPTSLPCLSAKFVKDITIPDGTKFSPGSSFTKTWELENTGSCTWDEDYQLIFVKGDQMSGDDDVAIGTKVNPGEKVKLSVNLIAPINPGEYRGDWMLQDDNGKNFGLGAGATKAFWVSIRVNQVKKGVLFNFVDAYCSADWESSAGDLKCPGKGTEPSGFVVRLDAPDQENRKENEPALWTNPEMEDDGWITGTFPAIEIQDDDRFIADIGCLKDNEGCDVIFRLNYRIGNGSVKKLGEWQEEYDGDITRINVDLSSLDGEEVTFILTVTTNGKYDEDAAFWLQPHILRD